MKPAAQSNPFHRAMTICAHSRSGWHRHEQLSWTPDSEGRVPASQQTRVSAFLISAHAALTRQLAVAVPLRLHAGWQTELHAQLYREAEIVSLLLRATSWVPDLRNSVAGDVLGGGMAAKTGDRDGRRDRGPDDRHGCARTCAARGDTPGGAAAARSGAAGPVRGCAAKDRVRELPPDAGPDPASQGAPGFCRSATTSTPPSNAVTRRCASYGQRCSKALACAATSRMRNKHSRAGAVSLLASPPFPGPSIRISFGT